MNRETSTSSGDSSQAPVVLLVFNRPEFTRALVARLREVRPARLLVVADGPRSTHPQDEPACTAVREAIRQGVDWDAKIDWNTADTNSGLRRRVSSGLDWAFEQVDRAIILEDDCLPHPTFFRFCTELLAHYEGDTRIGSIAGSNFQPQPFVCDGSYYFSRYVHCWGWASWRRAWEHFDESMDAWPQLREERWLQRLFPHPLEARYWEEIFGGVYERRINSWAYAWTFAFWRQNLLSVLPPKNMVTNVGVGDAATNTKDPDAAKHQLEAHPMEFPLVHPSLVTRDVAADDYSQRHHFGCAKDRSLMGRLARLSRKIADLPARVRRARK